ncbi:hypothetical protein E3P92_02972 [Wallemia ichthyophaga]|nr:hypothetical protein E3P92_02972 [Wallemia ichthyophaga]
MLVGDYGSSSDEEDVKVEQPKQRNNGGLFGSLPKPSTGQKRAPVQIKSDSAKRSKQSEDDDVAALVGEYSKRPQPSTSTSNGNGLSGLLGMLPAPKKAQVQQQKQQKFHNKEATQDKDADLSSTSTSRNSKHSAPVDIFSLGASTSTSKKPSTLRTQAQSAIKMSVAPELPDYVPPDPTPYDPYPGYYRKPSGEWESYEPAFYQSKVRQWQIDAGIDVEAEEEEERKRKQGLSGKDIVDVNAKDIQKQMRPTQMGAEKPQEHVEVSGPQGRGARARGQLSSLISEAVNKRTELEEKISQGKANRGNASKVYGF